MQLRGGKTNHSGRAECIGLVRHKDVHSCALHALGRHARFKFCERPFPLPTKKDKFYAWWVGWEEERHESGGHQHWHWVRVQGS